MSDKVPLTVGDIVEALQGLDPATLVIHEVTDETQCPKFLEQAYRKIDRGWYYALDEVYRVKGRDDRYDYRPNPFSMYEDDDLEPDPIQVFL